MAIELFCTMVLLSWTPRGAEAHLSALLSLLSPLSLSLYLSSLLSNSADPTSAASLLAHASPAHPASSAGPLWSSSSPGRRRGPSVELELARPAALAHGGARPACSPPAASHAAAGSCTYNIYAARRVQRWVMCVRSNYRTWPAARRGFRPAASSIDERGNWWNVVERGGHEL